MPPKRRRERLAGLARFLALELPGDSEWACGWPLLKDCLRSERRWAVLFTIAAAARVAAVLVLPAALAGSIDAATGRGDLTVPLSAVATTLAVLAASEALAELANSYYAAGVIAGTRDRLVRHALRLGIPGRRRFPAGDVLSRLSADATGPALFLSLFVGTIVAAVTLAGAALALALIHWTLAAAFLLGVPPTWLAVRSFVATAGEPLLSYQQLQADIVTRLLDAMNGARTIRASGTSDIEINRILQPLPALGATGRAVWAAQGRMSWQLLLVVPLLQVLVLSVAGFAVAAGEVTPGQLVAAAAYVMLALDSLEAVDGIVGGLSAYVGTIRIAAVLASPVALVAAAPGSPLRPGPGGLEFENVTVRIEGRDILDGVNLAVAPGTSVAVVGRSGAGKSALVSLVGRLVDPERGDVRLDGVALSGVEPTQVRRAVAYAFERPALLGGTIHDTIAYARPSATRAEVEASARDAQADHFIRLLPDGYDTAVARARFSGGEIQRLGLARAMLAGGRIVVLDDATSSLDTATEVRVARALERSRAGRTCVVVAHRVATAARADFVAWLDDGRIRALAPHAVLWSDPDYRRMFGAADASSDPPEAAAGT